LDGLRPSAQINARGVDHLTSGRLINFVRRPVKSKASDIGDQDKPYRQ
jgi:hypothetical protein